MMPKYSRATTAVIEDVMTKRDALIEAVSNLNNAVSHIVYDVLKFEDALDECDKELQDKKKELQAAEIQCAEYREKIDALEAKLQAGTAKLAADVTTLM